MLTRRGWALAVVVAGALAMAAWFSARSLNAVVAPALVALAAGYVQLWRTPRPELGIETPEYGFAGETATVSLDFDVRTPLAGTVRLGTDDGLRVRDDRVETTLTDDPLDFEVELRERGVRSVGPVEVVATDVFGLVRSRYRYIQHPEIVVFPEIHRLNDAGELASLHRDFGLGGRERFDSLREYARGDPLRDVHWKSSAKRADADLVVMEFEADERRRRVELLAEADPGRADDVAEATASVAAHLLDAGLAVGLTVPGDRLDPGAGPDHRTDLLALLARSSAGSVADSHRERADVAVSGPADADAVRVSVGDRTLTFDQLAGDSHDAADGRAETAALADGGFDTSDRRGERRAGRTGGERR